MLARQDAANGWTEVQQNVFGAWSWSDHRIFGGASMTEVFQQRILLAWERQDLGIDQRSYR
jgi:hypothetical protein